MSRVMGALLLVGGVLILQGASLTADSTPEEMAQQAEVAFRSAMEAWAYEETWRLWEMGTRVSRSALSRQEFTDRMRRGNTRPAAGRQVEAIQANSISPDSTLVYVRFGLEDKHRSFTDTVERPFLLRLEDGRWRVSLWDFVGLATYFPPDFFPNPLPITPPPGAHRPKGKTP